MNQTIRNWDQRTRDEVARFWGQQFIDANKSTPLTELEPEPCARAVEYLQSQRRFVNEDQVQHFLVHQRMSDLPPETQNAAIMHLAHSRLDNLSQRKISNLDVNTRQAVTDSLQRMGMFTDQNRRDELLTHTLTELEPGVQSGFRTFVAREYLDSQRLCDLATDVRQSTIKNLKQAGVLSDPVRVKELNTRRLSDVDQTVAARLREQLAQRLRSDLAAKTMEELPPGLRTQIHQALDEENYFVDQEKVGWYERRTLAQLPSELLRGLEQHLGKIRYADLATVPFRKLPGDVQDSLLVFLDDAGLFADRAARLRLTQAGTLDELPDVALGPTVQHLGRQWLVTIRDRRPPALPDGDREAVWAYLRAQGHFADQFKEELFAFQTLDEFGAETFQTVESILQESLSSELQSLHIGDMSPELQAQVRTQLERADYFVDRTLLHQVEESPVIGLPADLRGAVELALGTHLLADSDRVPVSELPAETHAALWRHLDEIGYFVDEKRQSQLLDRRLADLRSETYEKVVADLGRSLEAEIADRPVSELDDKLRQGLRMALEELGHFASGEVRAQVMAQPLGSLRREELDGLATQFGQIRLGVWNEKTLGDLPEADQVSLLAHLQARSWFLDQNRLDQLNAQPLADLESGPRQLALDIVRHHQTENLRRKRLAALDRLQRRALYEVLQQLGIALDESQMRPFRRQKIRDLDQDVYQELLRSLGELVMTTWNTTRFQDLEVQRQELLSAFLGRRIMGRIESRVLLYTISRLWIDYLTDIEDLRRGIGLEAYGQRDPLIEYKRRAFELFEELGENIRRTVVRSLFRQPPEPLATQ